MSKRGSIYHREKRLCISRAWSGWREWRVWFYRMRYDGLHFWSLHLGPVVIHNDFERVEADQ